MRDNVLRGLAAAVLAGAAVGGDAAGQGAPAPDYAAYTATQFIPFTPDPDLPPLPFTRTVGLTFRIADRVFHATMDTGTTGVMLPYYQVPGYDTAQAQDDSVGWEFLSSSRLLWVGRWVERDLVFLGPGGDLAVARVPVLAVEQEVKCVKYVEGVGGYGPTCPESARHVTGPDTMTLCPHGRVLPDGSPCVYRFHPPLADLAYIGVGFGREHDGQPQGWPDRNPLLNITHIGGQAVRPGTLRSGYIITADGVHVGLTETNTSGFRLTGLQPRTIAPADTASRIPRDWGPATVCIAVDRSACAPGAVLVDTGVDEMFLTVPPGTPLQRDTVIDPSTCLPVHGLARGSRVRVSFMNGEDSVAAYSFVVGDSTNLTAPSVVMADTGTATFVNTGRHLLRAFNVMLDADGGYFGVQPLAPLPWRPSLNPTHCNSDTQPRRDEQAGRLRHILSRGREGGR